MCIHKCGGGNVRVGIIKSVCLFIHQAELIFFVVVVVILLCCPNTTTSLLSRDGSER